MSTLHTRLLAIWSDVLGKPEIRVTDDFYELGGTSLRLIRVLGRIKAEFGIDIFHGDLLEAVTVESLASLMDKAGRDASKGDGPPDANRNRSSDAKVTNEPEGVCGGDRER
jgi:acyl carrier protein